MPLESPHPLGYQGGGAPAGALPSSSRTGMDPFMRNRVRVALLGCGRVAQRYFEVFGQELAEAVELVAVCDTVPAKTQRFVERFGCAAVPDLEALVAAQPDLVCVLTESGNHAAHAVALLEAGVPVIIEKPVALRPEDADRIAQAAARRNLLCAVVKQNRFNTPMRFLRAAMDAGRFGRPVLGSVRVHWCRRQDYYNDGWHGTWRLDGGVLAQQAIHHLDALQWLMGPVQAVCAAGMARLNRLEAEDTAVATVRFASGAMGTVEATTAARPRDFEASLTIVGEQALARVGGLGLNKLDAWEPAQPLPEDAEATRTHSQDVPGVYGHGHAGYLAATLDAFRRDEPQAVPVDVAEAKKSLLFLHAIYASMERGGWVDLAEDPRSARLGVGSG